MSNKYCQELVELRNKPAHELKEVGDQWRTPDNIFWGINTLFGPFVLDLFTDGDNAKCAAYYTAEDNALAHDWSERLAELKGAAFGNPPYSRASQHEGQYITGMRYIMKHASAMRDKGGRYVFLIKAATSEVWWPEDADHIAFIRGRIGFELPVWFIPKDEKQVPGITRAWTYRHWMGTGTVGVMIASSDLINPIPEESTETAARQHIGPLAPVAGSDLYVFRPVAHTVDFHIRVTPDTPEIRAAITAELRSFLLRDGYPQGELKVSRISEAISGANGEYSHQLLAPADNITIAKNELAILGAISWT
ncbi:phage N-6-adenine-methyltransferase [Escherichia coli]|nr:phage N-6-adenine-methyltransferase [Escherichia coli]